MRHCGMERFRGDCPTVGSWKAEYSIALMWEQVPQASTYALSRPLPAVPDEQATQATAGYCSLRNKEAAE